MEIMSADFTIKSIETDLTNEELALKIQAGEREYLEVLWTNLKKFVIMLAYRYKWIMEKYHFVDFDDFIQCGYFALVYAVERFNPQEGKKFTTYYSYWYKSEIRRVVTGRRINKFPPPTSSLNVLVDDEDHQVELIDLIPAFGAELGKRIEDEELRETIRKAINKLQELEMRVIYLTYFRGMSKKEVSYELNINELDVALHKRRAHNKLGTTKEINQLYDAYFS